MTALVAHPPFHMNWPRVGALSGTMALHVGLLLLLLAPPVAMEMKRRHEEATTVTFIMPEKKIEVPPDPVPIKKETPPPPPRQERIVPPPAPVQTFERTIMSTPAPDPGPPAPTHTETAPPQEIAPTPLNYAQSSRIAYPIDALRRHEQGTVLLRVLVGADGNPQSVEIEKSSGSRSLDAAARDAVRHLTFKPGTHNGVAQSAWARVPITFDLHDL